MESLNSRMPEPSERPRPGRRFGPKMTRTMTRTMMSSSGPMPNGMTATSDSGDDKGTARSLRTIESANHRTGVKFHGREADTGPVEGVSHESSARSTARRPSRRPSKWQDHRGGLLRRLRGRRPDQDRSRSRPPRLPRVHVAAGLSHRVGGGRRGAVAARAALPEL